MVKDIQNYITEHFYECTNEIYVELGKMYPTEDDFTTNVNNIGGDGTAKLKRYIIKEYVI